MPGTPPLGPAALPRVPVPTRFACRAVLILVLVVAAALAASPPRAHAAAVCPAAAHALGAVSGAAVEAAILCRLNAERTERGLAPLTRAGALEVSAQRHAADMVARGYFAHVTPEGAGVADRVRQTGYLGGAHDWTLGEDIGWGTGSASTPASIFRAFMKSPPHRRVILDGSFRQIGIGVAPGVPVAGQGAGATFVLDFGQVD
jgi:uncharacterized protein YkwD